MNQYSFMNTILQKAPKISIITINFNNKIGLKKTIESVISQTYTDYEYIIIDGNSTDGSKKIIEQYQNKISYSVSEPDAGVYNAMNKGIKVATGEYLFFLNSGDSIINPLILNSIKNKLDLNVSIVYGKSNYSKNNIFIRSEIPPSKLSFYFFFSSGLNHQATFIKRDLFFKYFLYNENYKICSDWEFFIYTICKMYETYLFIDFFICNYDLSGISAHHNNQSLYHQERKNTLEKFFPMFVDDYQKYDQLYIQINSKRIQHVLHIQKYKVVWKFFKGIINIFLIFLPKKSI